MGDLFSNLSLGFGVVFQFVQWAPPLLGGFTIPIPVNILLCLLGALVPIALIWVSLFGLDWLVKKVNKD